MSHLSRKGLLILSGLILVVLPAAISLIFHQAMPPGFGIFPPQQSADVPDFNLLGFMLAAATGGAIAVFLLFPGLFGFRRLPRERRRSLRLAQVGFPLWLWPGLALWLVSWLIAWARPAWAGTLVHYTFVPLWWGYILVLDGLVYRRTGGHSLLRRRPRLMLVMAVLSAIGWFFFEYLDYFVLSNWYYPNSDIFSRTQNYIWFALAYSTVLPSIFEWYNLLNTFEGLRVRYVDGPQLRISRRGWWMVFAAGVINIFPIVLAPFYSFPLLWLTPLLILTAALMLGEYWTPFVPIATRGDWSMAVLMGLACLFNYFLGEMWNFWSPPANPNFWKYDVPFINTLHIFEMPALGFFGYLFFGIMCWMWWLQSAYVLGFNPDLDLISAEDEGPDLAAEPTAARGLSVK